MEPKPAFQAYAKGCSVTAENPHDAAYKFFQDFPSKRKCNIIQGTVDGPFFTVHYGISSKGEWPQSYKNVTRATLRDLIGQGNKATPAESADYETRVRALQAQGMTRGDAQGVVDCQDMQS